YAGTLEVVGSNGAWHADPVLKFDEDRQRWYRPGPRPASVTAECTEWSTAGDYQAAVCGVTARLSGRNAAQDMFSGDATNGFEGWTAPVVTAHGWAMVSRVPHQCGIWSTMMVNITTGARRDVEFAR